MAYFFSFTARDIDVMTVAEFYRYCRHAQSALEANKG